eukprot:11959983-Heterocapsa_arctica.AAC.1
MASPRRAGRGWVPMPARAPPRSSLPTLRWAGRLGTRSSSQGRAGAREARIRGLDLYNATVRTCCFQLIALASLGLGKLVIRAAGCCTSIQTQWC